MATVELQRQLGPDGHTRLLVGVGVDVLAHVVTPTATVHQLTELDVAQLGDAAAAVLRPPVRRKR